MLADATWQNISWRTGTKGKLKARFAAIRVRIADGPPQRIRDKGQQHLPGEGAWLIGEHRMSGEKKYYLANLPAGGRNYLRHLDELRKEGAGRGEKIVTPPMPHIFAKYHDSITGPGKPVIYPKIVRQLDIEAELIAVIGKRAYHVEEADALDYVAGYTIINDVSARCLQAQGLLTISKGYETFCPMGPWMVTKDNPGSATALGEDLYQRARGVRRAHIGDAVQHQAVHRIAVASVSARSGRRARHRFAARSRHVS